MVGPAILLSIMFAGNAAFGLTQQFAQVFMIAREDYVNHVITGDCLEVVPTLPPQSADLIFADPPYKMFKGGKLFKQS